MTLTPAWPTGHCSVNTEWASFTDPRLCAAIVDRLTFGGNIIETGTESYRLAQTRARVTAQHPATG
ncbi:ATP-binding protein [Sphaerisporangium sp. NBC_01403]|uniref:ATP-binding protein n=1 Tax=Sphaerisporangium sp. NBC_01403 TaxID=2903599 RepID=UPI00386C080B